MRSFRGKTKSHYLKSAIIELSNKTNENMENCPKKIAFLDNLQGFQNRTIVKSALIEGALLGDSLYLKLMIFSRPLFGLLSNLSFLGDPIQYMYS